MDIYVVLEKELLINLVQKHLRWNDDTKRWNGKGK